MSIWHLVLHWIGVLPRTPSTAYNFWSGFGSDIAEFGILGGIIAGYRKINCRSPWCLRIGHHQDASGLFHYCKRHHPDDRIQPGMTLADMHAVHHAAHETP